jgi:O-antigen/teichoic acid export membrane protein
VKATRQWIALSIGGVFLRQLYTLAIGLITSVVFARMLGPSGTGAYATAQLVPLVLAALFNMGLGPAAVVLVNKGTLSFEEAKGTSLFLWRAVCLAVVPVAAVALYAFRAAILPNVDPLLLYLALCLFPFLLLNTLYAALFQCLEDFRSLNLILAAAPTITCAVGTLMVGYYGYGPHGAMAALIAATISTSTIAYWRLRRHTKSVSRSSTPAIKAFLSYGLRSNASDTIQFINYRADLYFVNFFLGSSGAGLYALAISLCEKLWLVADAITAVLFPRFARLGHDSRTLLFVTGGLTGAVALCGAIVLGVAAQYLIGPIFGPQFQEASKAINWLLPGVVAICVGKILAAFLAARGQLAMNLAASTAGAIVSLSSNLYLTPRYGITGAAIATSLGYFAVVLIVMYGIWSELRQIRATVQPNSTPSDVRNITPTI